MKKQILTAATLVMAGMIAGCGGSGSTTAGTTPTPTAASIAVSGKVADGYLANATVFMDKNGNYQLDAGEPSATTDANGAYTLNVDPADVGKYPIVALVVKGVTVDKDTNLPVTGNVLFSMPKDAVSGTVSSNFISPISTQVREMMETGKYTTLSQATSDLSGKLGVPAGSNVLGDYIAGQNTTLHTTAQNMATVMSGATTQVYGSTGSSTEADVNRYRNMVGTIFSNMSSVKQPAAPSVITNLISTLTTKLGTIPPGLPFRNMSAAFSNMGGKTGSGTTGTTGSTGGSGMM